MDRRATRGITTFSSSEEETIFLGAELAKTLTAGSILCLEGDLGTGKTTFVKGIAQALCNLPSREVSSPTFCYMHAYPGDLALYHFDLYRLRDEKDFQALGFMEYLQGNGISCIEWAEKIKNLVPERAMTIVFEHAGSDRRKLSWD